MKRKKIAIAMSGGVDSTATTLLLQEHNDLTGFFMQLDQPDLPQQLERVQSIADKIGVPLHVIDLQSQFQEKVLQYFSTSYENGSTPNPCVICNKEIKFGLFLDAMLETGCEQVATGHYANISYYDSRYHLEKGVDITKDQSYFLSRLSQKQLSHIMFPLGNMEKQAIYQFVKQHGFDDFEGKESQDVCFLDQGKIAHFLEEKCGVKSMPGDIIDSEGNKLGDHQGVHYYTIGQRRGLGIPDATPYYVVGLNPETNHVVAGKNDELFKTEVHVKDVHWIAGSPPDTTKEYLVRIRYTHRGDIATLHETEEGYTLVFPTPQRGVTPGQFAVLYDDNEVIGSGVII